MKYTIIDYKNGNAEVHVKLCVDDTRAKGYEPDALSTIEDSPFLN